MKTLLFAMMITFGGSLFSQGLGMAILPELGLDSNFIDRPDLGTSFEVEFFSRDFSLVLSVSAYATNRPPLLMVRNYESYYTISGGFHMRKYFFEEFFLSPFFTLGLGVAGENLMDPYQAPQGTWDTSTDPATWIPDENSGQENYLTKYYLQMPVALGFRINLTDFQTIRFQTGTSLFTADFVEGIRTNDPKLLISLGYGIQF